MHSITWIIPAVKDHVTELSLVVDGVPVPGLFDYRFHDAAVPLHRSSQSA